MLGDGMAVMAATPDLALALQAHLVTDLAHMGHPAQGSVRALQASLYLLVVTSKRLNVL